MIDTKTGTAHPPIPVGDGPVALAVSADGHTVYVANEAGGSIAVIDAQHEPVFKNAFPVGAKPTSIALRHDGRQLYVTGRDTGTPLRLRRGHVRAHAAVPGGHVARRRRRLAGWEPDLRGRPGFDRPHHPRARHGMSSLAFLRNQSRWSRPANLTGWRRRSSGRIGSTS